MKTEVQELDSPRPQFSRAPFTKFPPYLSHRVLAPRACPRAARARCAASGPVGPAHLPFPQGSPGPPLPGGISFNFGICSIPNVKDLKTSVPWGIPKAQWREGKMLEGIRDSDPRDGAGPHIGLGHCQPECASCRSNNARGNPAPYLPHSGGLVVGHPLLDRFLKSGRDEARLEVLGAAFHPLALARLGAVFIPETQAWKNERRRHAPPPPCLSLLAAGDCGWIEPRLAFLLRSQPCPFWGRRAELRLRRQGTHSWEVGSASCCLRRAHETIHSFKFELAFFRWFCLHLGCPWQGQAWRFKVQTPSLRFLSLDQASISLKTKNQRIVEADPG